LPTNAGKEGSIILGKVRESEAPPATTRRKTSSRSDRGRRHRPDKGRALRAAECSSIASLLLTTEALICDIPEEKKEGGGMPPGGGGMGGMY
jgi:chaperonin GroEL